ncbi:MAG: Sb-PDE family phosphodiesterase [Bacteroidia bacterium]|nr:Sb-PDE family phosphodiesterase [Bacteroidia bacterium]
MKKLILPLLLLIFPRLHAQETHSHGRAIHFPDVPGYLSLKCDLHQHTVFSDGDVWPTIRVQEAIKDSLDVISLTEHLEYQPHKADIPHPDRNRSHEIAVKEANGNLVVVRGSEITRSMPPGHCNAIFITDANKLLIEDPLAVFREAKKQGAFVFWNHPNWTAQAKDGVARLTDMHKQLIAENLLHGIEVVNDVTYSAEALQIALDHNLTIMGTSDIHGLVDWAYQVPEGGHRPITLVFATEKTEAAIKEGLVNRRTVVWYNNTLIGREAQLMPLLNACVTIKSAAYQDQSSVVTVTLENHSDAEFILSSFGDYTFHAHDDVVMVAPNGITEVQVKTLEKMKSFDLKFSVLNAITAPRTHPELTLKVKVNE